MNPYMEFAHKTDLAYSALCHSLCRELNLPQTAFDILLFLANNPECDTASDIVELRKIKANLVSVNVNRLVEEGYLYREPVPGDRQDPSAVHQAGAADHRQRTRAAGTVCRAAALRHERKTAAGVCRCGRSYQSQFRRNSAGGTLI